MISEMLCTWQLIDQRARKCLNIEPATAEETTKSLLQQTRLVVCPPFSKSRLKVIKLSPNLYLLEADALFLAHLTIPGIPLLHQCNKLVAHYSPGQFRPLPYFLTTGEQSPSLCTVAASHWGSS
jgi:hypothetical protein